MNKFHIIALVALAIIATFLLPALWLVFILVLIHGIYGMVRGMFVPRGHRIKHRMLKDYLTHKYGRDGTAIYKGMVEQLRKKGYR